MNNNERQSGANEFVAFPLHSLVAVFHSADELNVALGELKEEGFAPDEMRSFVGEEGMREMDFTGTAHGPFAELLRYLQHIGPDRTYLERYEKYMRDGDGILMVHAPQEQNKQTASEIMRKHSAHRVTYFGMLVIEEV